MYEHETIDCNRCDWNTVSASYQAERRISIDDILYGPLAPGERELRLLGDVGGRRVIEIGCGGGQNGIVLTRWGAKCGEFLQNSQAVPQELHVGVDSSRVQLAHARSLARAQGVEVQFATGVAEDLGDFADGSFDIALSSYALDYVVDLSQAYGEASRVLKPGGLFVLCFSHPWFQAVGWHLAGDPDALEYGDYAAWPDVEEWDWSLDDGTSAPCGVTCAPWSRLSTGS
jgi:SAM-dependent methyltransferase